MGIKRFVGNPGEEHRLAPSGGYTAGQMLQAPSGKFGFVGGQNSIAQNHPAVIHTQGLVEIVAPSALVLAAGALVFVNLTTQEAVSTSPNGTTILVAGRAAKAKADGDLSVYVDLNGTGMSTDGPIEAYVYEFDCETGVDTDLHTLLPAIENTRGVIILSAIGRVTEVFGGASQDQGIVTITDSDSNSLCTLTPSDAGADVVGDVIVGHDATDLSTGGALKTVAAGKSIRGQVTQVTSGAGAAGKMTVHLILLPLT